MKLLLACFVVLGLIQDVVASEPMHKKIISSEGAPKAIGPYSQAVQVGNTLYLAGQIAIDPETGKMSKGDIEAQTHRVLKNIQAVLNTAGYSLDDVVKSQVFLTDLNSYQTMNGIYAEYFTNKPPARAVVEVSRLPLDALVEIMVTAVK